MPYNTNSELPEPVQNRLPEHAQDIYREAFNDAWEEYSDPSKRRGEESQEAVAFKVAWSAVKKEYEKDKQGNWHKKAA
jgi:cation transport regulator